MKIGVIAANGKAGRCIIHEAAHRGHDVTAIVRNHETIIGTGYKIIEKDIFSLTPDDLRQFPVVVSAFGLPFDGKHAPDAYQKIYAYLIKVFEQLPDTRLLVVGGAGTLYTDETGTRTLLDTMPDTPRKQDPADMAKSFEALKNSSVKYTFFSPPAMFDPKGLQTRKYTLGTDYLLKNEAGESYISYEDYAVAMVDEIEQARFIRKRFTAVGERKVREEPPYYGIRDKAPQYEGLSPSRAPFNYDLVGQNFRLVFDDGKQYFVQFLTGNSLSWAELGTPGSVEYYECAKGADNVYFVNFEFAGLKPRTNITFIMDVEERLVTLIKTIANYDEKYPYMVNSENFFGAVDIPGFELPAKRHRFTTDLVGKRIHWHYSPTRELIHVYYSTDFHRLSYAPSMLKNTSKEELDYMFYRDPYDEKADFIKVKDGLYIFSCMEQNMSKRGMTGNSLIFLIDTNRVQDVGRSFGRSGQFDGKDFIPENYIYGAYGEFVESDGTVESRPNNYLRDWKTKSDE